ncbi:hypothetical protein AB833_28040 [Chromatiales bacterium (ex Bugula neritina AB1)]|nr:hypothetical protein AB833_28040 [Chromatiales bacterium (ex Bugula neritina AB1)]
MHSVRREISTESDAERGEADTTQIACQHCDMLVQTPELKAGEQAMCPGCGAVVAVRSYGGSGLSLACALASLIMLALSYAYPFLSLGSGGLEHRISLINLPETMFTNGRPIIAVALLLFTLVIPAVMMLVNISVLIPYHFDLEVPSYTVPALRWSHHLTHWSMVEVFVIGVLASLTKIISLADVDLGIGFWAYMLFALLVIISLWHFDRPPLWHWVDPHRHYHDEAGVHL